MPHPEPPDPRPRTASLRFEARRAPARRRGSAESVGQLLPKLLQEVGLGPTALGLAVIRVWDDALGERLAPHCRPDGVKNGVVHARVRDSAWLQRIQLEKPRVLARLRECLGESAPTELRLRLGPIDPRC